MGKGNPRAVEKGVLGQNSKTLASGSLNIPSGPVFYPTEEEFEDPLEYIYKIRPEAEPYGICKIVPPKSWNPPFALDLTSFTFPTKTQAIHQLQVRPPSWDSETFELEYNRFLEGHCGRTLKKRVVFEEEDLDLCKLFNAVKRYGGYDNVVEEKKWAEVYRILMPKWKISECSKHVLCQLYREHLYDYEMFCSKAGKGSSSGAKRDSQEDKKNVHAPAYHGPKRRRKNQEDKSGKPRKGKKKAEPDQICEQCKSGQHGEVMLLCDRCDKGWHLYCLSPPLKHVPKGNWYCFDCLTSEKDSFGFVPGKRLTLEAFKRVADRVKKKRLGSAAGNRLQVEKKFWEIVEGSWGEVEVMYGNDLDTSVYGSGFPRVNDKTIESVEPEVWDKYCASPWNLNNLPKLKGSMLQAVQHGIEGVTVPWLYIGMTFSSFCWHFEDHCFYSMNYHHWGEPKCWYSVPGNEAAAFEKVMRDSLPDLFDVQPDLLFQLVTMLNPSVLQENGVPVYSILQEPGNFVITFPRSYHGGFNLGLNCAEAVNFAPADWLPHGGFGAELYQMYRKASVLSHEELLCVVAKNGYDSKVSHYLKKEMTRIYAKEKAWRDRLWKNGIVKSSLLPPRKHPESVSTEEDPVCIICQQHLYLSAVKCRCRSSAYVCLEHWEHLCECKLNKRRLLYRHTLAELSDLVLLTDLNSSKEIPKLRGSLRKLSNPDDSRALTKKVKDGVVTQTQLAEEWIVRSSDLFKNSFSSSSYAKALREAEQFMWGGPEMEPVRHLARNLLEARNRAESINDCLSRIERWSSGDRDNIVKVDLKVADTLLTTSLTHCNEPEYAKLKDYVETAQQLFQEIDSALSSNPTIDDLERWWSKASDMAISSDTSEILSLRLSSSKALLNNVQKCISADSAGAVELTALYELKSEASRLHLEVPNLEAIWNLLRQAESCQARCRELLKPPIELMNIDTLLADVDDFVVNFPELELLRQYHGAAISWSLRLNDHLFNIHEREDQENVVTELKEFVEDGKKLIIKVSELPLVEAELEKACCREKALTASRNKVSMEFMRQIIEEAFRLQLDNEKVFIHLAEVHKSALAWEERARQILGRIAQLSEFEDAMRASEDIFVVLPSLDEIHGSVLEAKSWMKSVTPYLSCDRHEQSPSSLMKIEELKDLLSKSDLLKVSMKERGDLQKVLRNCEEWDCRACSLLRDAANLNDLDKMSSRRTDLFAIEVRSLLSKMEFAMHDGEALGYDLKRLTQLREAVSSLKWCVKALSQCVVSSVEEVQYLLKTAEHLPPTWACSSLCRELIDGIRWLQKAYEVLPVNRQKRSCKLNDAEDALMEIQGLGISFPVMTDQLESAISKHKLWQEEVNQFSALEFENRTWSQFSQLKDHGASVAFDCSELEIMCSEFNKINAWKKRYFDSVGLLAEDSKSLLGVMSTQVLGESMTMHNKSKVCKVCECHALPSNDFEGRESLRCATCNDCCRSGLFKLSPQHGHFTTEAAACKYCQFMGGALVSYDGGLIKRSGRPDLKTLVDLLSESNEFCVRFDEVDTLRLIVEQSLQWKARLAETLEYASAPTEDLWEVVTKLASAFKAADVAGVYDQQICCDLQATLVKYAWRVRANKLLEDSQRPLFQQIQQLINEGLAADIKPDDHYWQKLTELRHIGFQWADVAIKIAIDGGVLSLEVVFETISEGDRLPVHCEEELLLLRARSMLYCICRKPNDQKPMIACDECDEWYHFDCMKLVVAPKTFICTACKPLSAEIHDGCQLGTGYSDTRKVEPQTPSPVYNSSASRKRKRKKSKLQSTMSQKKPAISDERNVSRYSSGIECLFWRNKKPFRRSAKKRATVEDRSPFVHTGAEI